MCGIIKIIISLWKKFKLLTSSITKYICGIINIIIIKFVQFQLLDDTYWCSISTDKIENMISISIAKLCAGRWPVFGCFY
jgi:hypothetical protein